MTAWALEERAWPIRWLARTCDLALALLPFHALRARADRRGLPPFPGADPRMTNGGFRQAIIDLRALIGFLRARGASSVGAMGMSLGGYTTSLLATLEPALSFAVPMIPLASVADFALEQGRLGTGPGALAQRDALEDATGIVSPLARPSLLRPDRVLVLAGEADRITPVGHAEHLARHFGARVVRFQGGHLLQFGRAEAFCELGRWLRQLPERGESRPRALSRRGVSRSSAPIAAGQGLLWSQKMPRAPEATPTLSRPGRSLSERLPRGRRSLSPVVGRSLLLAREGSISPIEA